MARVVSWVFALAIPATVIHATKFGHEPHGLERRQGIIGLRPQLSFDTIGNLTTCEPRTIRWFYAGPPISMTLSVTNIGVTQIHLPPAPSSTATTSPTASTTPRSLESRQLRAAVVDMEISSSVNPSSLTFQWPSVNITSGSYQLRASIPSQGFRQMSGVFHVLRGPNTSCLNVPASHTSSTTPHDQPVPTSSQAPGSDSSPVSGVASSNPVNTSMIVGIVLGAIALILLGIAVYFYLRNRKRRNLSNGGGGGATNKDAKNWNALNSTDSRAHMLNMGATSDTPDRSRRLSSAQTQRRNYSQSSSIGPTEETVVGGFSEEKLGEYYNRKMSIASDDDSHAMALASLPSLSHHHQQRQQQHFPPIEQPTRPYPDPAVVAANIARRKSTDRKPRSTTRHPDIDIDSTVNPTAPPSSFTTTPSDLSHSFSTSPTASPDPASPSSPPHARRTNRQSLGRKRKPVPAYDESSVPTSPIPSSPMASESHLSHSAAHVEMDVLHHSASLQTHHAPSSAGGHYSTRSRPGTGDSNDLLHKTSFGMDGKQVHYLMPDLPADVQRQSAASSRSG